MMQIRCPFCGPRAETEFAYDRVLEATCPIDMQDAAAHEAVFDRTNPRGLAAELWRHRYGCQAFLVVERDTASHAIAAVRLARDAPT